MSLLTKMKQLEIAIEALEAISERCGPPENIAKYALEDIKGLVQACDPDKSSL